jgi:NADP-dependent aldehyde dehydrogenase
METHKVLIAGEWVSAPYSETFQATNPRTREPIPERYPVSDRSAIERALRAAEAAFDELRAIPDEQRADFLERFADRIERRKDEIVAMAAAETALPSEPRLAAVELPRTTDQLRQAANAARNSSWQLPTIDTKTNIRSMYSAIGPVCVFGPNNFPLAFNSVSGGDAAAAWAAGNPVIAKANSAHPGTTRLLADEALAAARETQIPAGTVQLIYRLDHADGEQLVGHPLIGATAYTGSRAAGLALKRAADTAGKPIYLELSSINPVVILPGAFRERAETIAQEFQSSCLMGTGQFCTNPGLVILIAGEETERWIDLVRSRFSGAPVGTLLSAGVEASLGRSIQSLVAAGAYVLTGGKAGGGVGFSFQNTLLRTTGRAFLDQPQLMQTEAFGNASLFVVAEGIEELLAVLSALEGNLTGTVYSDRGNQDEGLYERVAFVLRRKVGRLLNDKMPTGVAVVPAMNHGGPYPATGHPGFTAVGIPASLRRFAALQCYDNVRESRLPKLLRNRNLQTRPWRLIDGTWTQADIA